mmetsp:Transcript_27495/g.92353  ORF Transcript_27495/g.92353 Transcript_27495/m.92353 type:complete len:254 (-) Transcript_27495:634-1395(-)
MRASIAKSMTSLSCVAMASSFCRIVAVISDQSGGSIDCRGWPSPPSMSTMTARVKMADSSWSPKMSSSSSSCCNLISRGSLSDFISRSWNMITLTYDFNPALRRFFDSPSLIFSTALRSSAILFVRPAKNVVRACSRAIAAAFGNLGDTFGVPFAAGAASATRTAMVESTDASSTICETAAVLSTLVRFGVLLARPDFGVFGRVAAAAGVASTGAPFGACFLFSPGTSVISGGSACGSACGSGSSVGTPQYHF